MHYTPHQIEVSASGNTVWINSGVDGSCIGRFDKRFGLDVHRSGTEQLQGMSECLHCTHGPAGYAEWREFQQLMYKHYNIAIPDLLLQFPERPS
jgi:hypothetical protein